MCESKVTNTKFSRSTLHTKHCWREGSHRCKGSTKSCATHCFVNLDTGGQITTPVQEEGPALWGCYPTVKHQAPSCKGVPQGGFEMQDFCSCTQGPHCASHCSLVLSSQVMTSGDFKAFDYGSENQAIYHQVGGGCSAGVRRREVDRWQGRGPGKPPCVHPPGCPHPKPLPASHRVCPRCCRAGLACGGSQTCLCLSRRHLPPTSWRR